MKIKYFLFGAIFAFLGIQAQAQITEMLYQGFESDETVKYTSSNSNGVHMSTSIYKSGERALKLVQQTSDNVEIILDTLDFSTNTSLKYIALEFDHICPIKVNTSVDNNVGTIYYKRASQSDWTKVTSQDYNVDRDEYSSDFQSTGAFKMDSYSDWSESVTNNGMWKHERIDLDNVMNSSVAVSERKLLIKFVLKKAKASATIDTVNKAWWIDNLQVRSSAERMVSPRINMLLFPHMTDTTGNFTVDENRYPNSRGARLEIEATTSVTAGINKDSVYVYYMAGADSTKVRIPMQRKATDTTRYTAILPYFGYDTAMQFYIVAKDATGNQNTVTYPAAINSWVKYRYVRGVEQLAKPADALAANKSSAEFGFPADADHRCQFIYDSATMDSAGYGPGAITKVKFVVGSAVTSARTHNRLQIRMKNVPTNFYIKTQDDGDYTLKYFENKNTQVVYDDALTIPEMNANDTLTITLQDTFFYSGKDIVMQIWYDHNDDLVAVPLRMMNSAPFKGSIYTFGIDKEYGYSAFVAEKFTTSEVNGESRTRPQVFFYEEKNQPLLYDAGISELVDPNYYVAMDKDDATVTVKLQNFGALPFSHVRVAYNIDDTITGTYDYNETINGGQGKNITIASGLQIEAGFHRLTVWVEDSVTASGTLYRDHEPLNDTMTTEFIVCDGPMNGVRNIGGSNPHFNSIDEFLFSLQRCGIDDSLIVRLAPGEYTPFVIPAVTGLSEQNYIVFESMEEDRAKLYSDSLVQNGTGAIVSLEAVDNIRLRNLDFVRRNGTLQNMVKMAPTSENCVFEGCSFVDSLENPQTTFRIDAMLDNAYANHMTVYNCSFEGGRVGVNAHGQSALAQSTDVKVLGSQFHNQNENAIRVEFLTDFTVEGNEMNDVLSNAYYVLQMNSSNGTVSVQRNRIYTTHGAGAMVVSGLTGTADNHVIIANNMMEMKDDGTAAVIRNVFNTVQGSHVDIVYNAVKLTAPTRGNIAAAAFGGASIDNCQLINNIIASMDEVNYALSYQPGTETSNKISNNVYYSGGSVLNRQGTVSYISLAAWVAAMPDDTLSLVTEPGFLNGTWADLRTFNNVLKGTGVPFPSVTTDFYGNERGTETTCPGAFEFSSLPYDFLPYMLTNPLADNCNMPEETELVFVLRNNGVHEYEPGGEVSLKLNWTINGTAETSMDVDVVIPAEDSVTFRTGHLVQLPPNGTLDSIYKIRAWVESPDDINQTNDTNVFTVVSRYHPAAPGDIIDSVEYAVIDTIVPVNGVDMWSVYNSSTAPKRKSRIFWYEDSLSTEPFYVGDTLITDELREDQTYYIRQRRSMPIVRITQVEISKSSSAAGLTNPMPYWMAERKAALQLTNIGDATAYLEGDTLLIVSPENSNNNKVYVFDKNAKIEPGKSLVIQYASGAVTDTSVTIRNGVNNFTLSHNSNVAFVYIRNGVIEDALPINSVITKTTSNAVSWANLNVPSYVWMGGAVSFSSGTAGLIRVGFSGNSNDWELSSADNPMFLGSTNPGWVRYEDGGCEGDVAVVKLFIIAPPEVELSLSNPILPEDNCNLADEPISVRVTNFGSTTVEDVELHYSAGADTVTETMVGQIASFEDTVFTFSKPLNFAFDKDSVVEVRVWLTAKEDDPLLRNDTVVGYHLSLFTPSAPDTIATRVVSYATRDTLSLPSLTGLTPVWYDYDNDRVDTGYTYVSDIIYTEGQMGVSYMVVDTIDAQVGDGTSTNAAASYPAPYQSSYRHAKQQFIYTAHELKKAGLVKGELKSIAFNLALMGGSADSLEYLNYTVAIAPTADTVFKTNSSWVPSPQIVFNRDTMVIYRDQVNSWVAHPFDNPYVWDGVSSLVVQVNYSMTASYSAGVRTYNTDRDGASLYKNSNSELMPSAYGFIQAGSVANVVPNIKFNEVSFDCEGPITHYNIELVDVPTVDAAIFCVEGMDTVAYNSCSEVSLPVLFRNQGTNTISEAKLYYELDGEAVDSVSITGTFEQGVMTEQVLFTRMLEAGVHNVMVVARAEGDSIAYNDTVSFSFKVRFCAGEYSIKSDGTGDFSSVAVVADALTDVGILGSVVFNVHEGTYEGQARIGNVYGTSTTNTITFIGQSDDAVITATPSVQRNYVVMLEGTSHIKFENLRMESVLPATSTKGNVLVLNGSSDVVVDACRFKVSASTFDTAASCVAIMNGVANASIINSVMDSGGYAVNALLSQPYHNSIRIEGNTMNQFAYGAVNLQGVNKLYVIGNDMHSSNSSNSRGLIGMNIKNVADSVRLEKNKVYLIDNMMGGKRGIHVERATGTVINPVLIANNMVSTRGTDVKGLVPAKSAGIWIDSLSSYVNVMYNSVRTYTTNSVAQSANDMSYTMFVGSSTDHLQVMNNLFVNASRGYIYYVEETNNVISSNFNAYYCDSTVLKKFAWKQTEIASLADLQNVNYDDGNSIGIPASEPYFVADDDLHLINTNFVGKAQYNADVYDDIDGKMRKQIPSPTIGAHEMDQPTHDIAVLRIIEPKYPNNISNPANIETDSMRVVVTFSNNGLLSESGAQWYAYIEGYETQTRSANKSLGTMASLQIKTDTLMMPTVMGIVHDQVIHVVVTCSSDEDEENDEASTPVYLGPAYNLAANKTVYSGGCNLRSVPIKIVVKNDGRKAIPAGASLKIGYSADVITPSDVTISTMPTNIEETVTLGSALAIGTTKEFTFTQQANLYPTDTNTNIKVRVRGWCTYDFDVIRDNDTTSTATSSSPIIDSWFTPNAPMGHDTVFPYGTWGEIMAEQENQRPIRWYRDSTAAPFYAPTVYSNSTKWSNTPQYFHDSVYYLRCVSDKGCSSAFSAVHVTVGARLARDMAVEEIYTPLGNRVYMENDTVSARFVNYGTTTQTNVPVKYVLRRGNTVLQTATEKISSINAGQSIDYKFVTLLDLDSPTSSRNYTVTVYSDLTNDGARRNDTIRTPLSFASYAEDRYNNYNYIPLEENTRIDITRVRYNGINFEMPAMNRSYTGLADYENMEYPALHVAAGTNDSIFIQVSPVTPNAPRVRCRASVSIDFNRDGYFDTTATSTCVETPIKDIEFYSDSVFAAPLAIPECSELGYMRMRITVRGYNPEPLIGHVMDFMLFVDENRPEVDLALIQVASPSSYRIDDGNPTTVSLRMCNRGSQAYSDGKVYFRYLMGDDYAITYDTTLVLCMDTTTWEQYYDTILTDNTLDSVMLTETLESGTTTLLNLTPHVFPFGTTHLIAWHETEGDADSSNDTLFYDFHRYHTVVLTYEDAFDSLNYWYAPQGESEFSRNYWTRGKPTKTRINGTYSGDNAWVTDLQSQIVAGRRGNVSYLYSPVFNTSLIHADSLEFRLIRNLTGGSCMYVEYYGSDNRWTRIAPDSLVTWYNDQEMRAFSGTSATSDGYTLVKLSTSASKVSGGFHPTKLQLRFVYYAPIGTNSSATFGEGCAIDNFRFKRALSPTDIGVEAIAYPQAPHYGETIYPQILVRNYGTDSVTSFNLYYRHYGAGLPKVSNIVCTPPLLPGESRIFECATPFTITRDYPEEFEMVAYTSHVQDIYIDNDTSRTMVTIMPLDNDISAEEILTPLEKSVAGDTNVKVTLRMQNFGFNEIATARAGYLVNGNMVADEVIDFNALLGRPLASLEFFNYTFVTKMVPSLGTNNITAFVQIDTLTYIYNDTVTKRTQGIMAVTDVAATAVILDTTAPYGMKRVAMVIENRGTRSVNNFDVAYWVDDDTNTINYEVYGTSKPLPALSTGYYMFEYMLMNRAKPYDKIMVRVDVPYDNDRSNDTTSLRVMQVSDLEVSRVIVVENASAMCKVYLEVRNVGNLSFVDQQMLITATINGKTINTNVTKKLDPAHTTYLEFTEMIEKSPTRQYVGVGVVGGLASDTNDANNQTSDVEVVNYLEGVPVVDGSGISLGQNYPNPFTRQTVIPFTIPNDAHVTLFVIDATGHLVYRSVQRFTAGSHEVPIDLSQKPTGIYFYGIEVDGKRQARKMIMQ